MALFPGLIAHDNPSAEIYPRSLGPSASHLLGTTAFGQDMFAQVIYGTRPVLLIAFGVGLGATIIAMLIGVAAAYLGGTWDGVLNLLTDVLLVIPAFPLLIVIGSYLHGASTGVLIAVITCVSWSYTARQLRAQARSLRTRDFLEAAKVRGERSFYIITVEIIPTMTSLLVAAFLTNALYAVLFSVQPAVHRARQPDPTSAGARCCTGPRTTRRSRPARPCGSSCPACASSPWGRRSRCSTTRSTKSATRPCGRSGACGGTVSSARGDDVLGAAGPPTRRPGRRKAPCWPCAT